MGAKGRAKIRAKPGAKAREKIPVANTSLGAAGRGGGRRLAHEKIPVANTSLGLEEARAVYETVKSGWVSMGRGVEKFEREFCRFTGAKHAVAVNNGTAALHAALMALGVGEGDEVILPSLTFISTANVVLFQHAKPVLVECEPRTYNTTAEIIGRAITKKTKAIIPVDMNGMPVDYDEIIELGERKGIPVVADSAESLGAKYRGRKVGGIAGIHCFSFFPNKNITTGEGGMITLESGELAEKARIIRNQGQEGRYNHTVLGTNYRMTDVQAAIGREQLKKAGRVVGEKQKLAGRYNRAFAGNEMVSAPFVPDYVTQHAWYMYAVSVDAGKRDRIVEELAERGIETRLSFPPVHMQPFYRERFGCRETDLPISAGAWKKLIDIPLWAGMGKERQEFVIESVKELLK